MKHESPNYAVETSLMRIDGVPLPRASSRSLTQSYEMVELGSIVRSLAGNLIFLGIPGVTDRYTSSVSGDDFFPAQLASLRRGQICTVECVTPLMMPGLVRVPDLVRKRVGGSIRYLNPRMGIVGGEGMQDPDDLVAWTMFRPVMSFMVRSTTMTYSARDRATSWSIQFEEDRVL